MDKGQDQVISSGHGKTSSGISLKSKEIEAGWECSLC